MARVPLAALHRLAEARARPGPAADEVRQREKGSSGS
jgi:hypothetical protein